MRRTVETIVVAGLLCAAVSCGSKEPQQSAPAVLKQQDAAEIAEKKTEEPSLAGRQVYLANCAGCHGKLLEGASASPLVKANWIYGRDMFSIGNNIRNGIPSAGMPSWGEVLSIAELTDLFNYIIEAQTGPVGVAEPFPDFIETKDYRLKAETITAEALVEPWGIEFIDARNALITENSGTLFWMVDGVIDPEPITGLPPVDLATSTGGLFDLALDPDYAENGWVYIALGHSEDPEDPASPGMTRVIRGRVNGHEWTDTQYLFRAPESYEVGGSVHWGGRLLFDKAGNLYFSIGDMSQPAASQDLGKPTGKVFRIKTDGSAVENNPFASDDPITQRIFSIGNRNVQGIAQDPATGAIWASEHGPQGGDELNILKVGLNYGWPIATFGVDYDGSIISEHAEMDGVESPVRHWTPAPAVSALEFVTSDLFPKWRNDLLMGSLSREQLYRFVIEGEQVIDEENLLKGYGRIRDVKFGPDGALYLALNNPGAIVRLTPVETTPKE